MIWFLAIALAAAALLLAVLVFRGVRAAWAGFAAALALGLAGYAFQASPDLPGAPASALSKPEADGWALIDTRRALIEDRDRSDSKQMIVADGLARQGQYGNAAALLNAAVEENPRDVEAWLALGNALVDHADGALTQPALLAYRRAQALDPEGLGPGYFLGLAAIRQGQLIQGRALWQEVLAAASDDAAGREMMGQQAARLDSLIQQIGRAAGQQQ